VGARGRPTHLLSLHKPLADNLIDGGLDEAGRGGLAVAVAVRIVRSPGEATQEIRWYPIKEIGWVRSEEILHPTNEICTSAFCSAIAATPSMPATTGRAQLRRLLYTTSGQVTLYDLDHRHSNRSLLKGGGTSPRRGASWCGGCERED
jgi:hypothetical protein